MASVTIMLQEFQANMELAMFKYSGGGKESVPKAETSSTLPNAVAFVQLTERLADIMELYRQQVLKDAEEVKKYMDGLKAADGSK